MENETSSGKNGMLITALLLLIVPAFIQFSWMIIWRMDRFSTPYEKSDYYLKLFPSFLQNHTTLSLFAFLFCFASLILGALSIDRVREKIRWMAFAIVAVSFIIGLLCLTRIM
ncbi:MAG: hypothetical protein ABSA76_08305 [Bacteroidales bacterium]